MFRKFLKSKLQKGQAMVFFAIAVPTLFMFVAAVVEFGWWFINQSRLQNAADSAVLAGVSKIIEASEEKTILSYDFVNGVPSTYSQISLDSDAAGDTIAQQYANTNFNYKPYQAGENGADFFRRHSYRNPNYETAEGTDKNYYLYPLYYEVELRGQVEHLFSILNNFGAMPIHVKAIARVTESIVAPMERLKVNNVIVGNWEVQNRYRNINIYNVNSDGTPKLNKDGTINYKYATLRKEFFDASGQESLFTGRWNHYQYSNDGTYGSKNHFFFTVGSTGYRYEPIDVTVTKDTGGNPTESGSGIGTSAGTETVSVLDLDKNGNIQYDDKGNIKYKNVPKVYTWRELESINLDFAQDFRFAFPNWNFSGGKYNKTDPDTYSTYDWDIGYPLPPDITEIQQMHQANKINTTNTTSQYSNSEITRLQYRCYALINFFEAFPSIAEIKDDGSEDGHYYYEPLWARIESEPMWSYLGDKGMQQLNTVYQIIITINESNWMPEDDDGFPIPIDAADAPAKYNLTEDEKLIYRPIVFFYDGPETNMDNFFLKKAVPPIKAQETNAAKRQSKPIILNLNADFCGVIYAPNSPVAIVSHGHKFKGFIVAKSYKVLETEPAEGLQYAELPVNLDVDRSTILKYSDDSNYPTLPVYLKTETITNDESLDDYQRQVQGEIAFKDATAAEVEASLAPGSVYSIFNIEALTDTFFDPNNPYKPADESDKILLTTQNLAH